jgi:ATP synthase F1 gamma subunit
LELIKVYAGAQQQSFSEWLHSSGPSRQFSSQQAVRLRTRRLAQDGSFQLSFLMMTFQSSLSQSDRCIARDLFLKKRADEVRIVATRFVNTLTQHPLSEYLPVGGIKGCRSQGTATFSRPDHLRRLDPCLNPSPEAILDYLLSHYLNIYIYQVLLNAKASEQSARMVSMKTPPTNAEDLIKKT